MKIRITRVVEVAESDRLYIYWEASKSGEFLEPADDTVDELRGRVSSIPVDPPREPSLGEVLAAVRDDLAATLEQQYHRRLAAERQARFVGVYDFEENPK